MKEERELHLAKMELAAREKALAEEKAAREKTLAEEKAAMERELHEK